METKSNTVDINCSFLYGFLDLRKLFLSVPNGQEVLLIVDFRRKKVIKMFKVLPTVPLHLFLSVINFES